MFQMDEGIKANLDALSEARSALRKYGDVKEKRMGELITEEVKAQFDAIDAELQPTIDAVLETIKGLEELIKSDVVNYGATVKGMYLMATYFKGRVKWDTKALAGYAKAHPELLEFRSEGKPYASIKGI